MSAIYRIIDFSNWHIYEDIVLGSGRGRKVWLESQEGVIGLFKYPKESQGNICGEHWAEKIASEIAKVIELPCANIDLGYYNHQAGSMSYLITDPNKETMVEGEHYIKNKFSHYDVNKLIDPSTQRIYSLSMIEDALKNDMLFMQFLDILIFDCLIGNTDRHQNNWGVIRDKEENPICIAPAYDNGSSLCCRIIAKDVENYFKDTLRWEGLVDTKSKSMVAIDDIHKHPRHLEVLAFLKANYYNQTQSIIEKIDEKLSNDIIEKLVGDVPSEMMASEQKRLVIKFLQAKRDKMVKVYKS